MKNHRDLCIAVAAHKPYPIPSDSCYLPVQAGASLNRGACPGFQPDDEGENISVKNPYYSELAVLYWLWRNVNADTKGLVHYRRLLGSPALTSRFARNPWARVASGAELSELVDEYGVVLATRRRYFIETVASHYAHTFDGAQFDACRSVLAELSPAHVPFWDALMSSRSAHVFNMFVMRSDLFDSYCAWLFPILFELECKLEPSRYDSFGARCVGRVSERLLDPWLDERGQRYAELPVVSPEPVDWMAKGRGFLAAKFLGRKYKRSF